MKKKLLALLLTGAMLTAASAFGIAGCGANETDDGKNKDQIETPDNTPNDSDTDKEQEKPHSHVFNKRVTEDKFLKSEATCTHKAVYYKSCSMCGAVSETETFEHGEVNPTAHSFTLEQAYARYFKSAATCTHKAVYYKSCECGLISETETFEQGEVNPTAHKYTNDICEYCQTIKPPTEGLVYKLNADGTAYTVTGIGSATDADIKIASTYGENNLPVTSIGDQAFSYCSQLTSVTIPDSVTTIGSSAFYYCSKLTSITIPDSVTTIGSSAFYYCSKLTSITIPDSVTTIGSSAFSACNNLQYNEYDNAYYLGNSCNSNVVLVKAKSTDITSCNINSIAKVICNSAFYNCRKLTSVTISDSVTSIGAFAFSGCSGLISITIPDSVTTIGNNAFKDCPIETATVPAVACSSFSKSALKAITITSGSIGDSALYGYNHLTSITIDNGVTSIGDQAFSYCSQLTSVTIPDSVTTIGSSAFYYCSKLTSITIPDSVTTIGSSAFSACNNLQYNEYDNALYLGNSSNPNVVLVKAKSTDITSCNINSNTKVICDYAFYNCDGLTSVTISDSVTSIGDRAFGACNNLQYNEYDNALYLGNENNKYIVIVKAKNKDITSCNINENTKFIASYAFHSCSKLANIIMPYGVTSIGELAFYGCSELTSITLPNSLKSIGHYNVFTNCSSLKSINIPNGVTNIGHEAFSGCSKLTSVTIPESVTSIDYQAFTMCKTLEKITISNKNSIYKSIGNCILSKDGKTLIIGCTNSIIPDGVTSIGQCAFSGRGLTNITIPDSVTSIGSSAFNGCSGLTSITIPDSVTSIGEWAFKNCNELTTVNWNATACKCVGTRLDMCIFHDCYNLATLNIGKNVTTLNSSTFFNYNGLTNITVASDNTKIHSAGNCLIETESKELILGCQNSVIPIDGSVTSIGSSAFHDCDGLTSVTIPDSVTSIYDRAFYNCRKLISVTLGNGVTNIGYEAFSGCAGLTSVTIGKGVISIGQSVFSGCSGLMNVYYKGTEENWTTINIGSYNTYLTNATRYYYSETEPALNDEGTAYDGNYWHYDTDGVIPAIWTKEN